MKLRTRSPAVPFAEVAACWMQYGLMSHHLHHTVCLQIPLCVKMKKHGAPALKKKKGAVITPLVAVLFYPLHPFTVRFMLNKELA